MEVTFKSRPSVTTQRRRFILQPIRLREQIPAYLFLLPALLIFGVFAWYPIIKTVIFSFQSVDLRGGSTWVGLDNFARMIENPEFVVAWRNSFVFASLSIGIGFWVPIFVS